MAAQGEAGTCPGPCPGPRPHSAPTGRGRPPPPPPARDSQAPPVTSRGAAGEGSPSWGRYILYPRPGSSAGLGAQGPAEARVPAVGWGHRARPGPGFPEVVLCPGGGLGALSPAWSGVPGMSWGRGAATAGPSAAPHHAALTGTCWAGTTGAQSAPVLHSPTVLIGRFRAPGG